MTDLISKYLPWLLSAITIWMTLLAGNKHPKAWAIGLVNQGLWLGWIIATASWGFLPMNAALWAVYARNHMRWRREPVADPAQALHDRIAQQNADIERLMGGLAFYGAGMHYVLPDWEVPDEPGFMCPPPVSEMEHEDMPWVVEDGGVARLILRGGAMRSDVEESGIIASASRAVARSPLPERCKLPPEGWHCTRAPGHEGPCAALPGAKAVLAMPPKIVTTAPERIWLQVSDSPESRDATFEAHDDLTWCEDEGNVAVEVGYVRADLVEAQHA